MKTIIVAYDKHYGIGADNDLLWKNDLPADLKRFKAITDGQAVIMGRNTYDSIGKPLPNRQNIVISFQKGSIDGCQVVGSLGEAYQAVEPGRETFVIGGGQIFRLAVGSVDRIMATEVEAYFENATVFFPPIDFTKWQEVKHERFKADKDNKYNYDFVVYERI